MRAIVNTEYGSPDVLELREIDRPQPRSGEVLVRVHAASVNPLDWHFMRGLPYVLRAAGSGMRKPRATVRGVDLAGQVEAVGVDVTGFQPGDEVFGGLDGAFAEYACGSQQKLARKPAGLTFEQAAAIPIAGCTALQALRDHGQVQSGQSVLINGAGGGVGTFAVQIAKTFAAEVTGVCSTGKVALVRSLGADHVIDYTADDFTQGARYDLIVDCAGNHPLGAVRRALAATGTLVMVGGDSGNWLGPLVGPLQVLALSRFVKHRLRVFIANINRADLDALSDLVEAGKLTPVVDRTYPLPETAEAIRYLETGHAAGKTVISV
ncbi:MAG: NAD(P)-dependent alcohol dehydrogenase [Solirubrobacteraceae bacterium]|jgi:NADPH:quinone reductase-like Zn-dependent oxidoreductase